MQSFDFREPSVREQREARLLNECRKKLKYGDLYYSKIAGNHKSKKSKGKYSVGKEKPSISKLDTSLS